MDDGEHASLRHGEDGHRLGKAVDGCAPFLAEEQEDGRDQRSGVANADPPDEVDDSETPGDGVVEPPNAGAAIKQHAQRSDQHQCQQRGEAYGPQPSLGRSPFQDNVIDLVTYRCIGVSRLDDWNFYRFSRHDVYASSSLGLGLLSLARYEVRGRTPVSPNIT